MNTISVALCTYNGARYLREQLASISAQTFQPSETVVFDDASSDDSTQIVERFAAASAFPVHLHRNDARQGAAQNFARAIKACSGGWIALADQDDVWKPKKLEDLATVGDSSGAAYVFSDARLIDEAGREIGGKSLLARRFALHSIEEKFNHGRELDLMLKRDFIYGTTLMIRASVRDLVLPFALGWSHDTWIVNVLAAFGERGVPVLEPLVLYRQHGVQASGGMSSPKITTYAERVRAYEALRAHLIERSAALHRQLQADVLDRIDDKLRYLRTVRDMTSMPAHRRVATAASEFVSGRWWRYSPRTILVGKRFDLGRLPGFRS